MSPQISEMSDPQISQMGADLDASEMNASEGFCLRCHKEVKDGRCGCRAFEPLVLDDPQVSQRGADERKESLNEC